MDRIIRTLRSLARKQGGFTLMELLVVVAIMGVLAAVAVPNVAKFANKGKTEALATEKQSVQAATDAYMAEATLTAITGSTTGATPISDLSTTATEVGVALYPDYVRQQNAVSGYGYCWKTTGEVLQQLTSVVCP